MSKKKTNEEVKQYLHEIGLNWIDGEYIGRGNKTLICLDKEGYKFLTNLGNLISGQQLNMVDSGNPFSIENIKLWLYDNNCNIELQDKNYIGAKHKYNWKCKKCSSEFTMSWDCVKSYKSCPYCSGRKVNNTNSFAVKRPDLIRYLKDKTLATKYTVNSKSRIIAVCPKCKHEKETTITNLNIRGFSCPICSDGLSIPEKFVGGILKNCGIIFTSQYSPNWANKKRYDFYIPSMNIIIEVHGEQHYKQASGFYDSIDKIQSNDKQKLELALNNGILKERYIIIDCRYSTFDWLKENCQYLTKYLNLKNIVWDTVWEDCQNSNKILSWAMWNTKEETVESIANKIKMDKATIREYLKCGAKINKCIYNTEEELKKGRIKGGKGSYVKSVAQYILKGIFIEEYLSCKDAEEKTGINHSGIGMCCNNKRKSAGGFIWKYKTF